MKWTKQPPTEPGWYWWEDQESDEKQIGEVVNSPRGLAVFRRYAWFPLDVSGVDRWSGPIPEPQEEQQ